MNESSGRALMKEPHVDRAEHADRIRFSGTNDFRVLSEGGAGIPDMYEERAVKGDGPPLHRHPWPSWELVIEGNIRIVIAEQIYRLGPGDAVYIPPDFPHSYVVESETARTVGVNLSEGRFPSLQRKAAELLSASGEPDFARLQELAQSHGVEVLGPPIPLVEE